MIAQQIRSVVKGVREQGNGWFYFPECLICGRKFKMCFKDPTGYKCWSSNCSARGTIPQLVRMLRKRGFKIDSPIEKVLFSSSISVEEKNEQKVESFNIDIPPETIPITVANMPTYLTKVRGLHAKTILRFEMGYCTTGVYAGRIIIPIESDASKAFLAYSISDKVKGPKVLYPKGSRTSDMLFPFNYVAGKRPRRIVIVEGVMDALRIIEHGHDALPLALLGSNISARQIWLLWKLMLQRTNDITICLDSDATKKQHDAIAKISRVVGYVNLFMINLENTPNDIYNKIKEIKPNVKGVDPDDIRDAKDWEAIFFARRDLYWVNPVD